MLFNLSMPAHKKTVTHRAITADVGQFNSIPDSLAQQPDKIHTSSFT